MAVDVEVSEACAVRGMEQLAVCAKVDQDVGLLRAAAAYVAVLLGDGLVERRYAAAGALELRTKHLEGGAIFFL